MEHPDYTDKIKKDLQTVKRSLDKAAATLNHDEVEKAEIRLKATEEALLNKVKKAKGAMT